MFANKCALESSGKKLNKIEREESSQNTMKNTLARSENPLPSIDTIGVMLHPPQAPERNRRIRDNEIALICALQREGGSVTISFNPPGEAEDIGTISSLQSACILKGERESQRALRAR